jgi:hypothetical protein
MKGVGPTRAHICEWHGCDRRGEVQISRFAMVQHLRRHTNERPFLCTVLDCGARFSRIDNLQKHWRAHIEGSEHAATSGMGVRALAEFFGTHATPAESQAAAAAAAATAQPAPRARLSVAEGLAWYRRRCRQLTACLRHSVWEEALLEAEVAATEATARRLRRLTRALRIRHRHLELLQARDAIDAVLANAARVQAEPPSTAPPPAL